MSTQNQEDWQEKDGKLVRREKIPKVKKPNRNLRREGHYYTQHFQKNGDMMWVKQLTGWKKKKLKGWHS